MKPTKSEKTSLDALFRTTYSEQFSDLIDNIEITDNEKHQPEQVSVLNSKSADVIVIDDIEIGVKGVKIGKLQFNGLLAKTLSVLAVAGLLYHLFY